MRRPLVVLGLGMILAACATEDDALVVYAAASLSDIADSAAHLTPDADIRISVGPTSLLSQQIEHGAPADVFLAAHPKWVERLSDLGHTRGPSVELARGRLVVVRARGTPLTRSLAEAFAGAERIALADPSHVPAGQYARDALVGADLWTEVQDRVVPVADVRAALVAVQRGVADAAVVYASDAHAADDLAVVYRFPATSDIQFVGVAVSDHPEAQAWIRQLVSAEMQSAWRAQGFDPPGP